MGKIPVIRTKSIKLYPLFLYEIIHQMDQIVYNVTFLYNRYDDVNIRVPPIISNYTTII